MNNPPSKRFLDDLKEHSDDATVKLLIKEIERLRKVINKATVRAAKAEDSLKRARGLK